ncbi:FtsW/RodA/SpoVE family cell cycle protein, partial [Clostridium sp.]|uniref:FtsW/RodA/SpoVE family cell cycle protein n=1 Tax=Clostridium sp. TaxID=1506 RepID=UPI002FC7468A
MIENNKVEEYINKVCTLIKNKDVHYDINLELKDHIQTLKEEYLDSGMCEEEATEKALSHMGAPDLIGKELDKTHKAKVNLGVIIPLLCFSLFGLVTMYFLQSNGAVAEANYMKIFQKNLLFYIMGIGLMVGLYFFDYRRILPYSKGIYIASVIILIQQLVFNTSINGNYFLNLGFITVNIMPICLTLLVISLSGILQNWNWNNPYEFLKALGIIILPGMFMITRPITYGFLYFIACITLMIMSKAKVYQILISILSPFLSFFIYFLSEPYRLKRFLIFLDPARDPEGSGWLYIQVKKVIESSGAFGNGFTMKSN